MISPKEKKKNIFFESINDNLYHWKDLLQNPLILFQKRDLVTEKNISTCIDLKKNYSKNATIITQLKEDNIYMEKNNSKLTPLKRIFHYYNFLIILSIFVFFSSILLGISSEKLDKLEKKISINPELKNDFDTKERIENTQKEKSFLKATFFPLGFLYLGAFIAGFYRCRTFIKHNNIKKVENLQNIKNLIEDNTEIEKKYSQSFKLLSPQYTPYEWVSSLQNIYQVENNEGLNYFTYKTISDSYQNAPPLTGNITSDNDFYQTISISDYQKNLSENIKRMLNDKMEFNLGESLTQ